MASSLIKINEATAGQLQSLDLIDFARAERIIRYRQEVAPIQNVRDLAMAADLSDRQARDISHGIDWTPADRLSLASLAAPIAIFLVALALIIHATQELTLDAGGPAINLYNICVGLILLGSFFAITALAGHEIMGRQLQTRTLLMAITAFSAGFLMLVSLALTSLMLDEPRPHVMRTMNFVIYTVLVVLLLYAPTVHVRFVTRTGDDSTDQVRRGAKFYDLAQVPLVCIALALALFNNSETLVEEIFSLWTGFLFMNNGFEIVRGSSSYLAMLSAREKARRRFMAQEQGTADQSDPYSGPGWVAGVIPLGGGAGLLLIAFTNLIV